MRNKHWLTDAEHRQLEEARERGYLICRKGENCLIEAWTQACARDLCIRVETSGNRAQILLHSARPFSERFQARTRSTLGSMGSRPVGSLYPIVFKHGAYSQTVDLTVALRCAQTLSAPVAASRR